MLAAKGYYDGNCVQLLEPLSIKKNQNVIVTVMEDFVSNSNVTKELSSNDPFLKALDDNSLVIKTGLDVDKYMEELRGNDRI